MQDEARVSLTDVLVSELSKLRRLSAGAELLGQAELKSLEVYARIVKLLERGPKPEGAGEEKTWSSDEINRVLEGRGGGLPVVPEAEGREQPHAGGARGWDNEAETSFQGL